MKKKLLFIVAIAISTTMCSQNSIVESNNSFTFDVMRNINKDDISKDGTNMFVSPFSIYDALAMAYDGAAKKTAKEMRSVMKFKKDQTESHDEFVKLLNEYKKDNSVFTITNAAVAQKNYNFLDSYMKCLKDFDATISQADFSKPEERADAVKKINDWVSKNTNKKITDLLSNNDIDELTRLILLNAIYFNANWSTEFKGEKTRQMTFYGKNSVEYVTDFMNGTQNVALSQSDDAQMMKIDYEKEKASMFIIMPKENVDIDKYISELDEQKFASLEKSMQTFKADVSMPKFKIESRFEMKKVLMEMGIKAAFTKSADFSKMNGKSNLLIDEVIHKSFIEVSEKGTEAAAATAVVVREKSMVMKDNPKVVINRPFVFVIRENKNNAILFIGKYVKPEKSK
ncbi:MAG: serpin family protein [Treponema sp.]|jgi:serpin B|nr:serpin family protein [Bacteroidales bacterium]MBQ1732098.1 serpin family protein [Bacteroidales bacterium]MBQ2551526.1 serpin family protein [Treponema sp.]MBR3799153.1 serpin family protein [Bacteroidales bacterium]